MTLAEFGIRVLIAAIAGILIGFERQWHHKETGLRTNTLVSIGACIYVLLSFALTEKSGDVTRIIGQVVTGVGFLGAGIIFREGISVHGLTSAATIWCSSAIGCLAGAGFYVETLVTTVIVVLVNSIFEPLDKWLRNRK
ncbi:MAG: MgtC/SapB family protein [Chitinophagales bacterium]